MSPDRAADGGSSPSGRPSGSVVIAAHDEARTISANLSALLADLEPGELEVAVVCNGCTDDTAAQARRFGDAVVVVELPVASKVEALRAGDRTVSAFPRIYLDADVVLTTSAARRLIASLGSGEALAVTTELDLDVSDATPLHRRYLEIWRRLPTIRHGVAGRGVYALSEAGRQRFGEFPDVTNDDAFVDAVFQDHERAVVEGARSTVLAVGSLSDLIRRKTRISSGKRQLVTDPSLPRPRGDNRAWLGVVRREPRLIAHVPVYVCVAVVSRCCSYLTRHPAGRGWS